MGKEYVLQRAYVEIGNICNLRCSFCPTLKRAPRQMSPEEFRRVAEKLRGATGTLYLHVMGEPLCHPHLGEMIRIAGEMGYRVCVTTNGTLLRRFGAVLLENATHLHRVSISLHCMEEFTPYSAFGIWTPRGMPGPIGKTRGSRRRYGRPTPSLGKRVGAVTGWVNAHSLNMRASLPGPPKALRRRRKTDFAMG